jgi:hypothetical protein
MHKTLTFILFSGFLFAGCASEDEPTTVEIPEPIEAPITVEMEAERLFVFKSDSLYGFMNASGEITIQPTFERAKDFSDGFAAVRIDDSWGFIDTRGDVVIPCQFQMARSFYEGRAAVTNRGKMGFVDTAGMLAIGARFDGAWSFSEGRAIVLQNGKLGFIDSKGKQVVPCRYDEVLPYSEGLAVALDSVKGYGFIDLDGKWSIEPSFESVWPFSEGLAPASVDGKWGYIDSTGLFKIPATFDYALGFEEQSALVKSGELWGFIDLSGNYVVGDTLEDAWDFSDGLAAVQHEGLWGYIDQNAAWVIPAKYNVSAKFHSGLAKIEEEDSFYYINQSGRVIAPKLPLAADTQLSATVDSVSEAVEVEPTAVVPDAFEGTASKASVQDTWTDRRGGLGRYAVNYILEQWDTEAFVVLLGKSTTAYYTIEGGYEKGSKNLQVNFVITHVAGNREVRDLMDTTMVFNAGTKPVIKDRLLNAIWYWDSMGLLDRKKLRKFKYSTGEANGTDAYAFKVLRPNGNTYFWRSTENGWSHREEVKQEGS